MRTAAWCLAALAFGSQVAAETPEKRQALTYSAASIVNAASNQPGPLAPNTFFTIYGRDLAFLTRGLQSGDLAGNRLPTVLPGTGLRVMVNHISANIYFVSPQQINFLVPANLLPGKAVLTVTLDGRAGPQVATEIAAASPALFQMNAEFAIAVRADGAVCSPESPAQPGTWVTLYATGLGDTTPEAEYSMLPRRAAPLRNAASFRVELDGSAAPPDHVAYAGIAPGFAGLYQINLLLPASTGRDPQIRVGYAERMSPAGVRLAVAPR